MMTATTTQDTRSLVRQFLDAHSRGDAGAIRKLLDEDATWHLPRSAGVGPFHGTAGNLSQHLGVLESAGLITLEKGYVGKRARTWISITKAGQAALADEIAQLKLLISRIDSVGTPPG